MPTQPTAPTYLTTLRALEGELNSAFAERRNEIRGLLVALASGEHVLLLGQPGTAKSALVNALARALGDTQVFTTLMTRFTVPEEVFGPISLKGLEQDRYCRVTTGYLPEARFAFLDECFKANSAILNALLTVLNERAFDDGGQRRAIPLELAVGASNELPTDTALAALWDRFVLRYWVDYVKDRSAKRRIYFGNAEPADMVKARLTQADLDGLRAAAQAVQVPADVQEALLDLAEALEREGIKASDRRLRKCVRLVKAHAAVEGRSTATRRDLLVLQHALWDSLDQRATVAGQVAGIVSPNLQAALRLVDAATEMYASLGPLDNLTDAAGTARLSKCNGELRRILGEMKALGDTDAVVAEAAEKVAGMQQAVARAAMRGLGL